MDKIKSCKYLYPAGGGAALAGSLLLCGVNITNVDTTRRSAHIRYGVWNTDPVIYNVIVPAKDTVMATFTPPIECASGIFHYVASVLMTMTIFYIPLS